MKRFKLVAALFLSLSLWASESAYAGGTWSGVSVAEIKACTSEGCPPKGWVVVKLSAGATGTPPSCSSSNRNFVVIDTTIPAGAFAAALMQTAKLSGMTISVAGSGSCSLDPAVETAASVTE